MARHTRSGYRSRSTGARSRIRTTEAASEREHTTTTSECSSQAAEARSSGASLPRSIRTSQACSDAEREFDRSAFIEREASRTSSPRVATNTSSPPGNCCRWDGMSASVPERRAAARSAGQASLETVRSGRPGHHRSDRIRPPSPFAPRPVAPTKQARVVTPGAPLIDTKLVTVMCWSRLSIVGCLPCGRQRPDRSIGPSMMRTRGRRGAAGPG